MPDSPYTAKTRPNTINMVGRKSHIMSRFCCVFLGHISNEIRDGEGAIGNKLAKFAAVFHATEAENIIAGIVKANRQ